MYPDALVSATFSCSVDEISRLQFDRDVIECNGIRKSKKELARLVADALTVDEPLKPELQDLLQAIRAVISTSAR